MDTLLQKIQRKLGMTDLISRLVNNLSGSEFNTFMMEVFRQRSEQVQASHLLRSFRENRFVWPSTLDPITVKELELHCLKCAHEAGFKPITLSPVTPLGTCSATASFVSQNNVLSALRGTEVVADLTNVLALQVARDLRDNANLSPVIKYASTHRHIRCQYFDDPNYTAHFSVFGLVSGGRDQGDFLFEIDQLISHLRILLDIVEGRSSHEFGLRFYIKKDSAQFIEKLKANLSDLSQRIHIEFVNDFDHTYYDLVQFNIYVRHNEGELDIADGGFVNWTQQLLSDRKQRMCTSAIGIELFSKLIGGVLN